MQYSGVPSLILMGVYGASRICRTVWLLQKENSEVHLIDNWQFEIIDMLNHIKSQPETVIKLYQY